ncbi:hypothetical protein OX284_001585 [Flavobacterium sp. SUN046]|uniref:hypothetical protein n=1 Tax=Flavobacterium sp. SUN046 TaxID=3002440 RepID=UPI002DBBA3EB|nr:hypothetical protein [Flavobacterium sp. SUN046]MEC4048106.1 hypothetical protein [Flavobacterium sp. SUN046]
MKKIILLFILGAIVTSCNVNSLGKDSVDVKYEVLPLNQVTMPTAFAVDSVTEIPVKYVRPTSCHYFEDFYYKKDGQTRTVAIYSSHFFQDNCQADGVTLVNEVLKFKPAAIGTYHFKFWTGTNSQNIDQYLEFDAVVTH